MASSTEADGTRQEPVSNDLNKPQREGWLMKRTRLSHTWKKMWCYLVKTEFFYSEVVEGPCKKINLEGCEMLDCMVDKKSFAWGIKPHGSKRTFYFHAESEQERQDWLQAICFAKASGNYGENASQTCVVQ